MISNTKHSSLMDSTYARDKKSSHHDPYSKDNLTPSETSRSNATNRYCEEYSFNRFEEVYNKATP